MTNSLRKPGMSAETSTAAAGGLAVPAVELPFGRLGGGIVAVAEEDHLGLVFVPGQLGVLAFAVEQRDGRIGGAGLDGEDAVLRGIVRRRRRRPVLAVVGEV